MKDLYRQEAERLAKLPARDRKVALDVHRRIAADPRLSMYRGASLCARSATPTSR